MPWARTRETPGSECEVGIFDPWKPNAFAHRCEPKQLAGAVSSGLLQRMNEHEVEAVLGHEISHVANGDMVTSR